MRTIKTVKGQTLMDIAIQEHGNFQAVFELLKDNPHLSGLNDYPAGQMVDDFCDFDFAHPIKAGVVINIREESEFSNPGVLRQLNNQKIVSE